MAEDSPTGPIPNAPAVDLGRGKQVTISPHAVDIPNVFCLLFSSSSLFFSLVIFLFLRLIICHFPASPN